MQQNKKLNSGMISGILLPLGLICLFAFCSLALALMGGRAYKQIQAGVDDSFGTTVAASYLRTKLSQNNGLDVVSLRQQDDIEMLVIKTQISGRDFETRIFMWQGQLMETFVAADSDFSTGGGISIARIKSCDFSISAENLFTAEIESMAGTKTRTAFALLTGGEQ